MPTITYDSGETAALAHYAAQTSYGSAPVGAPTSSLLRAVEEIRPLASILAKHKAGIEASQTSDETLTALAALATLGSPLQVIRTNAAGDAYEHADPAGGGLSGLTAGNVPYADSTTTLAEGPIFRCAAARIGFGGITDSFPGMRWAGTLIDFVTAAAGAFIGINASYFQFGNLSKLQNVSNGVVKVTTDADALGGLEVGTLVWNDGTQWPVTLGVNGSGGTGKRALVVDNA